ncbi:unnamed protein product [Acanthoscelides obtectus]|uniref:Uncharacterized protein n=1 Tax=Acanthoscelides obtectus TaxID=200917 RepID=A0A9P0P5D0_ACAOB|nr:unnamed protein product [Acanthoscelides obtectus]CAK1635051.1 hypothetical protein AOBTE_LOCUS9026 [Acanthoscelides obtectus]
MLGSHESNGTLPTSEEESTTHPKNVRPLCRTHYENYKIEFG